MMEKGWTEDKDSAAMLKKTTGMSCLSFKKNGFICFIEFETLQKSKGTAMVVQMIAFSSVQKMDYSRRQKKVKEKKGEINDQ